ncbi:hypothetical protein AB4Y32_35440 [Paraburkholderia phymatum]|uniref:Uncharacterized protein n=1 Tax=Paraburkholderia phymatum TaxID=148447 RepID=A0ACC6UBB0_9BURK
MRRFASHAATLIFALAATALASAAMRSFPDVRPPPIDPAEAASADSGQADLEALFFRHGIDPASNKARIIVAWVEKIRDDPVIATGIAGGAQSVGQIFLDPAAREDLMSQGLVRLAPQDRLKYVQLVTKFLDELVPVNCFGLSNMRAVMNQISLREMTDSDVDQYFNLLFKVLLSDASNAPVPSPTPQQYAAAERQLTRTLVAELHGDQTNLARFASYTSNPSMATPSDACWATRVTLHAIIAMPDPERDLVLLRTIMPNSGRDASSRGQRDAPGTATPLRAASQPGSADAP